MAYDYVVHSRKFNECNRRECEKKNKVCIYLQTYNTCYDIMYKIYAMHMCLQAIPSDWCGMITYAHTHKEINRWKRVRERERVRETRNDVICKRVDIMIVQRVQVPCKWRERCVLGTYGDKHAHTRSHTHAYNFLVIKKAHTIYSLHRQMPKWQCNIPVNNIYHFALLHLARACSFVSISLLSLWLWLFSQNWRW